MSKDIYCVRSALQCASHFFDTKRIFWKILRKICCKRAFSVNKQTFDLSIFQNQAWDGKFRTSSKRQDIELHVETRIQKSEIAIQLKVFTWYKINMMTFQLYISIETLQVVIFSKIVRCMIPLKPFSPKLI